MLFIVSEVHPFVWLSPGSDAGVCCVALYSWLVLESGMLVFERGKLCSSVLAPFATATLLLVAQTHSQQVTVF